MKKTDLSNNEDFKIFYDFLFVLSPLFITVVFLGANDFIIDSFKEYYIYIYYYFVVFLIIISFFIFLINYKKTKNKIILTIITIFIIPFILLAMFIGTKGYKKYVFCKEINNNIKENIKQFKDSDKNYCGSIRYN